MPVNALFENAAQPRSPPAPGRHTQILRVGCQPAAQKNDQRPGVGSGSLAAINGANAYRNPYIPAQRLGIDRLYPGERIWAGGQWLYVAGILRPAVLVSAIDCSVLVGYRAAEKYLGFDGNPSCEQTSASTLETISGLDRFTMARHFRRAFGTGPDRYRTMRRLAIAREAIEGGLPLAVAAADSGFADQSHLTPQFKRTYGLTPARWAKAVLSANPLVDRAKAAPPPLRLPSLT